MIKACMFDLDGTILYTLESIAKAGNRMLKELGFETQPIESFRSYCGDGANTLVMKALVAAGGYNRENYDAGIILYRKFLAEDPLYKVVPYAGMRKALGELKEAGIRLAVNSNKPDDSTRKAVAGAYPGDIFEKVHGQRSGVPVKPDPTGALMTLEEMGIRPEECLYIGDMTIDINTGRNAGMKTVGVAWGYQDEAQLIAEGADYIVRKPEEIPEIIKKEG